jgi:hypothetical protein
MSLTPERGKWKKLLYVFASGYKTALQLLLQKKENKAEGFNQTSG